MRRFILLLLAAALVFPGAVYAQRQASEAYYRAQVTEIIGEGAASVNGMSLPYQRVRLRTFGQPAEEFIVEHGTAYSISPAQLVHVGDTVVVAAMTLSDGSQLFQIADIYRLRSLAMIIGGFFALIVAMGRWKGIGSIVGLLVSLAVIIRYIVPRILAGDDPLFTTIVGASVMLFVTMYLAHGFSRQTTIAVLSTCITLILTAGLSYLFVSLLGLQGLGSEEAYSVRLGEATGGIQFRGLLLGGMILGALGVLDDITTGQTAAIFELLRVNPHLNVLQLIRSGLRIGQEHIASLVNTLVLAYAGASLPLFIMFVLNPGRQPFWVIANSEFIVEEITRTVSGSVGLILAVPITTVCAAWAGKRLGKVYNSRTHHHE